MCAPDSKSCSFIVKIWIEETAEDSGHPAWRGHITHVGNSQRRYIETVDQLSAFIAPYLKEMGVSLEPQWRAKRWLNRWRQYLKRKG